LTQLLQRGNDRQRSRPSWLVLEDAFPPQCPHVIERRCHAAKTKMPRNFPQTRRMAFDLLLALDEFQDLLLALGQFHTVQMNSIQDGPFCQPQFVRKREYSRNFRRLLLL
jgi:hypothetical protein